MFDPLHHLLSFTNNVKENIEIEFHFQFMKQFMKHYYIYNL